MVDRNMKYREAMSKLRGQSRTIMLRGCITALFGLLVIATGVFRNEPYLNATLLLVFVACTLYMMVELLYVTSRGVQTRLNKLPNWIITQKMRSIVEELEEYAPKR